MSSNSQLSFDLAASDRRNAPRREVFLAAKAGIRFDAPVACIVRNISAMGALLEFSEPVIAPKTFRITIDSALFSADCELRHQNGRLVGVMFISNRMEALAAFG
ncbi:MAG: PilZ domain-containing protein [Hyphomicrobium sp.]|nr:hypothetical protein [Hyphomicrobium sp.]